MAITKEDLEVYRLVKYQERTKLEEDKVVAIEQNVKKVQEYSNQLNLELENEFRNKFTAIDAQIDVINDLIANAEVEANKPDEIL